MTMTLYYVLKFMFIYSLVISLMVIRGTNPIHSLLYLIFLFLLGSLMLFILQVDYFALLFMVVYVGAIVVLFLFIVMMLEIKTINIVEKFSDMIHFRNFVVFFIMVEIILITAQDFYDLTFVIFLLAEHQDWFLFFSESNLYTDYSKLLVQFDNLKGLGVVLYTQYRGSILLGSLLLFVSMLGAILMTLDTRVVSNLKIQQANMQSLRHPVFLKARKK